MADVFDKSNFVYFRQNPEAVFFDNASTTHIHDAVLEQILDYYAGYRASPGRGGYQHSEQAEHAVANSRKSVANLLDVDPENILFTTGATQGLNWIARWSAGIPGNVIVTDMEHNSNIVPWLSQGRTEQQGLEVVPISEYTHAPHPDHTNAFNEVMARQDKTSLLSITAKSNLTGKTVNWEFASSSARIYGHRVALDLSQNVMLESVKGYLLDYIDYAVFSGHKIFGPTGIGVLYVKNLKETMPMYGGGGMVEDVSFQGYHLKSGLDAHQAGTPDTAGIIGMGMCCELLCWYGVDEYKQRINEIANYLIDLGILDIPELNFLGETGDISNIFSFTSNVVDVSDIATLLDQRGISVRHGKLCAYPYANRVLNYKPDAGILRISTAPYNDYSDCEKLVTGLKESIHKLTH